MRELPGFLKVNCRGHRRTAAQEGVEYGKLRKISCKYDIPHLNKQYLSFSLSFSHFLENNYQAINFNPIATEKKINQIMYSTSSVANY